VLQSSQSFFLGVPVCKVLDWITDKALLVLLRKEREKDAARLKHLPSTAPERTASKDVEAGTGIQRTRSNASASIQRTASSVSQSSLPAVINDRPIEASCPTVSNAVDCLTACASSEYIALIRTSVLVTLALELHNM
jgi:hypothetical protein